MRVPASVYSGEQLRPIIPLPRMPQGQVIDIPPAVLAMLEAPVTTVESRNSEQVQASKAPGEQRRLLQAVVEKAVWKEGAL